MGKELELEIGSRYSIALLIFFIPYFIFEVLPSLPCPHLHIQVETSIVTSSDAASVEYRPTSGRECQLARLYCIFLGSSNAWNGTD